MKCIQYWADKADEQPKNFGNIAVQCISERAYLDYVVRNLKADKVNILKFQVVRQIGL